MTNDIEKTLIYIFPLGEDYSNEESSNEDMKLDGSIISLELAPLTKRIKISNIPPATTSDDMRFKFSNQKIGGGQVTDMMLDKKNGVADVYFEKSSGISLFIVVIGIPKRFLSVWILQYHPVRELVLIKNGCY